MKFVQVVGVFRFRYVKFLSKMTDLSKKMEVNIDDNLISKYAYLNPPIVRTRSMSQLFFGSKYA